jgi:hypothetical protein
MMRSLGYHWGMKQEVIRDISKHWKIPKTPCHERICHICETKRFEDENHFFLECPPYTQIRSQFQNICHNIELPNLLSHQNYNDLGTLLMIF